MSNVRAFREAIGGGHLSINKPLIRAVGLNEAVFITNLGEVEDQFGEWFFATQDSIQHNTGLSRFQQESARKELAFCLETKLEGVPAKLYYRVDWEALANKVASFSHTGMSVSSIHTISKEITKESAPQSKAKLSPSGSPVVTADPFDEETELTVVPTDSDGEEYTPRWGRTSKGEKATAPNRQNLQFIQTLAKAYNKPNILLTPTKQFKALNKMKAMGITSAQIEDCIEKMIQKPYYQENGWDLHSVLSELSRS